MARSPWPSAALKTRVYVWTRRVGIWGMVVGAWETIRVLDRWGLDSGSETRDLFFWGAHALIGFILWYRLRNIEAEIRDQAGARAPDPA